MNKYFAHFSILIVILIAAIFYERQIRYGKILDIHKGTPYYYQSPIMPWLMVFGYLTLLAGFRLHMNDTTIYMGFFESTEASWFAFRRALSSDIKYFFSDAFCILFKMFISKDFHMWCLLWATIESILIVNVLRRESVSFLDACFFFFASTLYYNYFSMMRQWMAVAIQFWGSRYLRDNRTIKYFIVCFVAGLFHPSVLIMIPLYYVTTGNAWKKKQICFIVLFAVVMIFLDPILSRIEIVLEGSTYDYAISAMRSGSGSSIIRAFIAAVPVFLAFLNRRRIDSPMINACVNLSVINLMLNILGAATNGLFVIRLSTYMSIYNTILFPYLLNFAVEKNKNLYKIGFYVVYLLLFIYQMNYMNSWGYRSDVLTWLSNY